jgi:LPS sulfotransferase NodH
MQSWDQFGAAYDLAPYDGWPATYLIASTPRSGSHYLGHLLFETGLFGSPLEYLHPAHLATWQDRLGTRDVASTLRALFRRRTSASGWFGIKAHWSHFAPISADPFLLGLLDLRHHIRIVRQDRLAQAISFVIAEQTQSWISFNAASTAPSYDPEAIAAALRLIETQSLAWDDYFRRSGVVPVEIAYEALMAHPAEAVDGLRAVFGLESIPATRRAVRMPEMQASAQNAEWHARYRQSS